MASQVTELDRLSWSTRRDSSALVERMSAQTAALAEAARELCRQAADDRHGAAASSEQPAKPCSPTWRAKSSALNQQLGQFTASVEESFAKAQKRAAEINASLAAATQSTATQVVGQFENIRENAGREREQTQQALQAAYQQASAQLAEIMGQTAERFRQSVAEVKQMAGEVQRELDGTRQELRRGVFELPQGNQRSGQCDAPRGLRPDQGAEGTRCGRDRFRREFRHRRARSRAADRAGRGARPASDRRADRARRAAGDPVPRAPHRRPRACGPCPRRRAVEDAGARWPWRRRQSTGQRRPRLPAGAQLAPERRPGGRAQPGGLVVEPARRRLARRAAAALARSGADSLEAISTDIARLVDSEAAAELWDRWRCRRRRARSAAASIRSRGQQTFDDIRRRYRAEAPFRDSVNRYVQEFERLLTKIGQNDRDGSQSRLAMLSDSGKVYIMLAHASGRLG